MRHCRLVAALLAVLGLAALVVARLRPIRIEIAHQSMSPTLEPGDYIIAVHRSKPLRRGAIVVFEHPDRPGFDLVKRVIGLPGETIEITGGTVRIDGTSLSDPWGRGATQPDTVRQLPAGTLFVLGDLRMLSADDSRMLGPLPAAAITHTVVGVYWPRHRIGRVAGG